VTGPTPRIHGEVLDGVSATTLWTPHDRATHALEFEP